MANYYFNFFYKFANYVKNKLFRKRAEIAYKQPIEWNVGC